MIRLRNKYINFVSLMGLQLSTMFDRFAWYSLFYEKNTIKSRSFHNYIKGIKPKKQGYILLKSILQAVKSYLMFMFFFVMAKIYGNKNKRDQENLMITYYGVFDSLRGMPDAAWVYIPTRFDWQNMRVRKQDVWTIYQFVRTRDFIIVLFKYLYIATRFILGLGRIKSWFTGEMYDLFRDDLWSSFAGKVLTEGLFYDVMFVTIDKEFPDVKRVVYPYEGLAWEKALCYGMGLSKTKIGVCHSTIPVNALNNFEPFGDHLLVPNYIAVSGRIPHELMTKNTMYGKVFISGTLRYQYLKKWLDKERVKDEWKGRNNYVILGMTDGMSMELIDFVAEAYDTWEGRVGIVVRPHPCGKVRDYGPFRYGSDVSMETVLELANVVITCESSVAVEALAFGVSVICPELLSFVDINPLTDVGENVLFRAKAPVELKRVIDELSTIRISDRKFDKYRDFVRYKVREYFSFRSSEEMIDLILGKGGKRCHQNIMKI